MSTIAIVLGRKNSKGLKNKNIRKIHSKPMFLHVIDEAKKVKNIKSIYVSSDSKYILSKAEQKGCNLIRRPKFLSSDKALLSDAIYHAVKICKKKENDIKNFLILICNSICFDYKMINQAIKTINKNKQIDTVTTVSKFNMFSPVRTMKIKKNKLLNFIPNKKLKKITKLSGDRDKSTDAYFCTHSFTLSKKRVFLKPKKNLKPFQWMGNNKYFIKQESCVGDVDFEWQIPVVKWWINKFKRK